MRINEVIIALKDGKKVRHSSWGRDDFIYFDKGQNAIFFYHLASHPFNIEPDTLISIGWFSVDNPSETFDFQEALNRLVTGQRIKNEDDEDVHEFIEMDMGTKTIIKRKMETRDFSLDHVSLFSTEWMIIR